jgi:hypothetical protein
MVETNLSTPMPGQPKRRRKVWPWLAAGGALVAAATTGGVVVLNRHGAEAGTSQTAAAPPPTQPPTPTPTPAPSPTDLTYPLGKRVALADGLVDAAALRYRQPVAAGAPRPDGQPGYEWAAAEVRVCLRKKPADGKPLAVSEEPWELVYPDGGAAEPSSVKYVDFPLPQYPIVPDRPMKVGRCTKGWITFAVPKGRRPSVISYAPEGATETTDWKIS